MSVPTTIGRYEIRGSLGEGGMGTLYLAWDPKLERHIAIKTLTHDDQDFRERFAREARAAARLRHPHIITIHDVGEYDGQPYIAMEYCQGENLEKLLRRSTDLSVERKIALLEQLCDGLAFAHRAGIVHRDVKPANLMVNAEGQLKILDFGIARFTQSDGLTQAGSVIGTLNYMSPEQLQGHPVDHRSDIFSVGIVAYELFSGRQAFPGQLSSGLLLRVLHEEPPALAASLLGQQAELVEIVAHAMAKDPRARYQDLSDMRRDLLRVQGRQVAVAWERTERMAAPAATALDVSSVPSEPRVPGRPAPGRTSALAWLVRAAILLALGGLALIWLARTEGPANPPVPLPAAPWSDTAKRPAPETVPTKDGASQGSGEAGAPSDSAPTGSPSKAASPVRPGERSAPTMPSVCARLLERVSLGETLSEAERRTLASKCRS